MEKLRNSGRTNDSFHENFCPACLQCKEAENPNVAGATVENIQGSWTWISAAGCTTFMKLTNDWINANNYKGKW